MENVVRIKAVGRVKARRKITPDDITMMYKAANGAALRYSLHGHDRGDLVQHAVEAIVKVVKKKGQQSGRSPLAWYRDIARKSLADHVSSQLAQKRNPEGGRVSIEMAAHIEDVSKTPEDAIYDAESLERVQSIIKQAKQQLGDREARIIDLKLDPPQELVEIDDAGRDFGGIKNSSVARFLGLTKNQVDHSMWKIRKVMSALLAQTQE